MKRFIIHGLVGLIALSTLNHAKVARGGPLVGTLDASVLIQSTATDTDFALLTQFFGLAPNQTLVYSSSSTTTAWSGTLTGLYLGTSLTINYINGNISAYSPGPVTWDTTGNYGSLVWSGTGSATITDTSATTFRVAFNDSVELGSNTASLNKVIQGTVLPDGTIMYGDPTNPEVAATGSGMVNGTPLDACYFSYKKQTDVVNSDVIFTPDDKPPESPEKLENSYVEKNPDGFLFLSGTITSPVPEPSSLLLLVSGLVGAVTYWPIFRR